MSLGHTLIVKERGGAEVLSRRAPDYLVCR